MAKALQGLGVRVPLIDANTRNVRLAKRDGLAAQRANILAEGVKDDLDLSGIGRLLAVTPNDEVNALAALHFGEVFESDEVYPLPMRADGNTAATEIPRHLRGRPLSATDATHTSLDERFDAGARVRVFQLAGEPEWLREATEDPAFTPLFRVRGEKVRLYAEDATFEPQAGDVLLALVDPPGPDDAEATWREHVEREATNDAPAVTVPGDGVAGAPVRPAR